MIFINAFWVGGLLCALAQILIDKTKLTPARILVAFVVVGVILGAIGVYEPLIEFAGAGVTVPLSGFGNLMAQGVKEEVVKNGILGAITGGLISSSAGITSAIVFGFLASVIGKPKTKN